MPRPGFYNDNEYRAYPFIFTTDMFDDEQNKLIPDSAVVDAGIIMGLDSEFDGQIHTVWLHEIRRVGDSFEFELHTNAPGAAELPLVFTREATAGEWQNEYVESEPYIKDSNSCAEEPAWSGFIVTGPLTDLAAALSAEEAVTLPANAYTLEPARIQSLVRHYLRSISLGNLSRPQARLACESPVPEEERKVIVNSRCIAGDIRFKEGYNCQITQREQLNELTITAGKNLGTPVTDGELCANKGEVPFYEGEQPPEGSQFFSGGPACNELISSINGVGGPDVNIVGGTGINIIANQETNTITIELSATNNTNNC